MPKCPILCGECCDQWAYISVLWHKHHHLHRDDLCPNLDPDGCRLPRKHRPRVGREHLCSRARQVLPHKSK